MRWVLAVSALAATLRAALLWQFHDHPLLQPGFGLDTDLYVALAQRVAAGDLWLAPGAYPAAPLYIYVLGAMLAAGGGSLLAARVVQILLGAGAVWLVGDTARRLFGVRTALPAAMTTALCGVFAFNEILILQSALDPVLTAAALWMLSLAPARDRAGLWVLTGAVWAALALNRPNALAFAAAIAAAVIWRFGRRGGRPLLAYLVGLAILLAPVAIRNRIETGDFVLVASHGGFNFFVGNNAQADGTYRSVPGVTPSSVQQAADARRVAETALGRRLSDAEVSRYFYDRAAAWVASAPADAVLLLLRKIRYVFSADEIALNYSYAYYRHDERSVLALMPVGPWVLLPLGLIGLVVAGRADRAYYTWAAFVPIYALSVAVFFVSDRYRLPLLVPLAAAAPALIVRGAALAGRSQWRGLSQGAAAVATAVLVTWWPTGLDDGRGEERTAMAELLLRRGEIERGQAMVDGALPAHREPSLLLFRAGRALQAAKRPQEAIARYQQALEREPGRPEVRFFLGQCLLDQRRAAEAIPHLDAAVTAGVRLDVAPFDLARALAWAGNRDGASRALGRLAIPPQADIESFIAAGRLAESLADAPLAIRFYRSAAERDAAPVAVLERLGVLLAMSGRSREAVAVLERALGRAPREASLHLNLAVALAQEGQLAPARVRLAEALRLRPDYPQARALAARLR